jgi:hypothetical protein
MESIFGVTTTQVPEVTHFCIADNEQVGDPKKRNEEIESNQKNNVSPSLLTAAQCQEAVANAVLKLL